MFGIAGARVAAALDGAPGRPWAVTGQGIRRLLPPLWLFGVIVVPLMIWHGWTYNDLAGSPLRWRTLVLWILPISDPPGSAWGNDLVEPVWFIRTCLWFILLSPALVWTFRHWPKRVLAVPLVILAAGTAGVFSFGGRSGDVILTLCIFGACWMLGVARYDNSLRSVPLRVVVPLGLALLVGGLTWAFDPPGPAVALGPERHSDGPGAVRVGRRSPAAALHPSLAWVSHRRAPNWLVSTVNTRAVTIYLWNSVAIICAAAIIDLWGPAGASAVVLETLLLVVMTAAFVGVAVVIFGWVEDLSARRAIQLIPRPLSRPRNDRACSRRGSAPGAESAAQVAASGTRARRHGRSHRHRRHVLAAGSLRHQHAWTHRGHRHRAGHLGASARARAATAEPGPARHHRARR